MTEQQRRVSMDAMHDYNKISEQKQFDTAQVHQSLYAIRTQSQQSWQQDVAYRVKQLCECLQNVSMQDKQQQLRHRRTTCVTGNQGMEL